MASTIHDADTQPWDGKARSRSKGKWLKRALGAARKRDRSNLCGYLAKITDQQTRTFVEEAIKCHEAELYRSAIVMSWLDAVDLLRKHIHQNHLAAFNAEAKRVNSRWKPAKSQDEIGKMGEGDFLDQIETLSIIGKNVKAQLKACLDLRNGCGHPNSLKVSVNKSAVHIEILLLNVFEKYA